MHGWGGRVMSESAGARRFPTVAVVILVAAVVGVAGLVAGSALTSAGERVSPAEGSAEAGFARDMQAHHEGGVAMAQAALDLVGDQDVRRLAQAIVSSQTAELAVLNDMLDAREAGSAGR